MKLSLLFAIIICGHLYGLDWSKESQAQRYYSKGCYVLSFSLSISDSIPIVDHPYPDKCFGVIERTKRQQSDLDKYGCYSPLF